MTRGLGAFLVIAACAPSPQSVAPGPLVPTADGFDVGGTGLEIGFGRAEAGAIEAATKLLGRPPADRISKGRCSRASWSDGLTMYFINGAFAGWADPTARGGSAVAGVPC
ncbi:MAG: hypothetical protein AAGK37_13350 [Pseudomonadota bacterium]